MFYIHQRVDDPHVIQAVHVGPSGHQMSPSMMVFGRLWGP